MEMKGLDELIEQLSNIFMGSGIPEHLQKDIIKKLKVVVDRAYEKGCADMEKEKDKYL